MRINALFGIRSNKVRINGGFGIRSGRLTYS